MTLDHVKAKCKGGEDLTANVVPADRSCNASKGSEDWRIWFRRQSFYSLEKEQRIDHWLKTGDVIKLESEKSTFMQDPNSSFQ